MKEFEYIGVMISVVAYYLIVTGELELGFTLGLLASSCLVAYFGYIKSVPSVMLQMFFICANIYGLYNVVNI
jgi:drug/metabolite transporter (DMT)-like permease